MSFVVVYDANVLYPSTLRDLLIRLAQAGLVQAKWTDRILDEVFDNLTANRPIGPRAPRLTVQAPGRVGPVSSDPDHRARGGRDGEVDALDLAPADARCARQLVEDVQSWAVCRRR